MTRLQGERIFLRPHEMRDKQALLNGANEPEGARLTGTHATFMLPQIEAYIARNSSDERRAGWVICLPDDTAGQETVVGEVVINEIDTDNRSANIRIALFNARYFGQGYGSEALRLAIDYGFKTLKLHRISLGVYNFNPRAIHVYEKLGFKHEGVFRDSLFWEGAFHDEHRMSILDSEWA